MAAHAGSLAAQLEAHIASNSGGGGGERTGSGRGAGPGPGSETASLTAYDPEDQV
jgi:hypothetical protein